MIKKRSLIRAGAVLGVALAAGHLVQTLSADRQPGARALEKPAGGVTGAVARPAETKVAEAAKPAAGAPEPVAIKPVLAGLTGPDRPAAPAAEPAPALAAGSDPGLETAPRAPAPPAAPMAEPAALAATETPAAPVPARAVAADTACTAELGLAAGAAAMIAVSVTAPCRAGERVVLRHAGLAVAERLGPDGRLSLDLPAFSPQGEVSVLLADASVLRDAVPVPAAADLRRFAVQWIADDAFQLHAYENGAPFGSPGDVSAANPVSPAGGTLVRLGDPELDLPMLAEVYTWPADGTSYAEPVVEAAVTETTCGRDLLGEVIHLSEGTAVVTDLTLSMPGCEAIGDILVLNNLVPETTLAAVN